MKTKTEFKHCINCAYFRNSPAYLEQVFKGMITLGSGHGSVRKDDGICGLHDIYLSADNQCDQFSVGG